ncbi:cation efflux family protein [Colletotrichum musicola]|uniref:Cation efflux family protein n=1 Tax=Colletotrichum musicola TaxID=2175873 RepID=A0A8H6U7N6_9PEZI|nr:cation efflux family protein [Colletotrichum musicola]
MSTSKRPSPTGLLRRLSGLSASVTSAAATRMRGGRAVSRSGTGAHTLLRCLDFAAVGPLGTATTPYAYRPHLPQLRRIRVYQTSSQAVSPCDPYLTPSAARLRLHASASLPLLTHTLRTTTSPSTPPAVIMSTTATTTTTTTTTSAMQTRRSHGGHSHGHGHGHGHHHHHHDNVYLTSSNKNDAGVRITRIGLFSNLGMAIAKGAGGYAFGSQAMVADAWHSLTDLASDILTLATVSWSLKPPTESFPTGFGKIESLGSLGVSSMLLGGGLFMCWSSLLTLHAHLFLDPAAAAEAIAHAHHHGHSHSHDHSGPSLHAAWLAVGTVVVKEWLYQATMKVAVERKSSVLASNAVHHRVDSWTGIVTLLAILGANFIKDAAWLDPVGGLLISLLVIKAGAENTMSALYELADRSIDEEVKESVEKYTLKSLSDITEGHEVEVRDVSGVKSGQNYLVDIELAVPGAWSVEHVRDVEDKVRTLVGANVRGVRRIKVRYVPKEAAIAPKFDEFIPGEANRDKAEEGSVANGNGHEKHH